VGRGLEEELFCKGVIVKKEIVKKRYGKKKRRKQS
jgi:hypothetical protein